MELLQNQLESVSQLQLSLRRTGILSAVIGGIAVAVWGDTRATKDADLKVLLTREQAHQLLEALPEQYKVESSDPEGDLRQFGFIFTRDDTGVRIDLLLADLSFDRQAIERGREIEVAGGTKIVVCSPEDLIIYKMISTRAYDHEDPERSWLGKEKTRPRVYRRFNATIRDRFGRFNIGQGVSTNEIHYLRNLLLHAQIERISQSIHG